jgi:hypothetical protein
VQRDARWLMKNCPNPQENLRILRFTDGDTAAATEQQRLYLGSTPGGASWLNPTLCAIAVRFATAVAGDHATLATKRALPLTWAGAGSHQLAWRTH